MHSFDQFFNQNNLIMTDSTILTIIIAVAAVAVLGTGAFFLARHLRGKIRLYLPVTGFDPGDPIKGSFELHAKKPIKGKRLIITLIGTQHIRTKRGDKTETHSHEVYRKEEIIEESRDYPAGFRKSYDFELTAPNKEQSEMPGNELIKSVVTAANMIGNRRIKMRWKLEARLVAKGIDLVGSKRIHVNGF